MVGKTKKTVVEMAIEQCLDAARSAVARAKRDE
jgi:hypothetical protein